VSRNGAEAPTVRIVVLIKPGTELDESDACAVEQALRMARRRIDVRVSVLTAGAAACAQPLRAALALGADDGVHVLDDGLTATDALALSRVLATALRRLGFDLVLCGATTDAPNLSALPAMVAERLGVPALCQADSVFFSFEAFESKATEEIVAIRESGTEAQELAAAAPVLVSVAERSTPPRYPPFPAIAEARRKLVSTWTLDALGIEPESVRRLATATVVRNTVLCARAGTIVKAEGDPHAAAVQLADFLTERHLI
jgi:electron transfer flavoprotein beta subunit